MFIYSQYLMHIILILYELVPKKTMAPEWMYFGLEKNEEGRIKTEDIWPYTWKGGNTSNLVSHLKGQFTCIFFMQVKPFKFIM